MSKHQELHQLEAPNGDRQPIFRLNRRNIVIGGIAVIGVGALVAGGLFVQNALEEDPQQSLGLTTNPEVCVEESDQNANYSVPIIVDRQMFTLSTSINGIGDLVDVVADTDGSLDIENLRGDAEQRLVGTGEEEVIEIFEPNGSGPEDNQTLMRVWSDGHPQQLVFSVPCE